MNKYPLIGGSICAVVLLVLASLTNVVGYQTVQSSNQKIITTEVSEKELLFQTIVDIENNKGIQKVILGSKITGQKLINPDLRFSFFNHPILTEKILKRMYTMGVILLKIIGKSKIHSMFERYQVSNQGVQKEINVVIERDATLKGEMTQLSSVSCDCENENTTVWHFPVICELLYPLVVMTFLLYLRKGFVYPFKIMSVIGSALHCSWA